jgi:cob(I)alamin adenosyltransferase
MKIYTRTGDGGTTSLFGGSPLGGERVAKDDPRIATLGAVDELNASLGVARATGLPDPLDTIVARLQCQLFQLGAEVATPKVDQAPRSRRAANTLGETDVTDLERDIDACEKGLPPLKAFILPGGTPAAAQLHLARAICRRAERNLASFARRAPVSDTLLKYLNRTSDLLFVLARKANGAAGVTEIEWSGLLPR